MRVCTRQKVGNTCEAEECSSICYMGIEQMSAVCHEVCGGEGAEEGRQVTQ